MGRAMLIICSAALISIGFISISTSNQGRMLTENTVDYAEFTMAKNTAHTAIQMAMQEINKDDTWMTTYDKDNPWTGNIEGRNFELYIDALNDVSSNNYWDDDSLRIVSRATQPISGGKDSLQAEVVTVFLKGRFSGLVPDFGGALQFPTGFGSIDASGNAHSIDGSADHCEDKPAIVTSDEATKDSLDSNSDLNLDGEVAVDSTLNYEPTDELIERLKNSGNAITVDSDYSGTLGTEEEPGVFFLKGDVKLTGQQSEGYGIMVIQDKSYMSYDSAGTSVDIRGNFEFNGLVIFENASLFEGKGTPTINGSVLVGQTSDNEDPIDIKLAGNIEINYDCDGENYAKQAAADAVEQNRYTKVVSSEGTKYIN
ncbi:MAG: hypothetical protein WD059_01745 [Balneolaceae bacterium]